MDPEVAQRPVDRLIGDLATRQHGVVSRAQIIALGLSAAGVQSRVRRGRLHALHRGVYAVGHSAVGLDGARLAEGLRLFDLAAIAAVVDAHTHRHGAARLRRLLAAYDIGEQFTRSELEERFLALCERAGVPRPAINARVAGLEVDFYWPQAGLVAELDGLRYHHTQAAFERDRERDAHLLLHGIRVVRITRRRVIEQPRETARLVLALNASRR